MASAYLNLLAHSRAGRGDLAVKAAAQVLDQFISAYGPDSTLLSIPEVLLGIAHLENEDPRAAVTNLPHAIDLIEFDKGPFDSALVEPLQAMALGHLQLDQYSDAKEDLRRAQHITRRHGGVYTEAQLTIVDQLIDVSESAGTRGNTDALLLLYLRVHENLYGPGDPRTVPALLRIAEHFAEVGSDIPSLPVEAGVYRQRTDSAVDLERVRFFKRSIQYYKRAIDIVEQNYGDSDSRLMAPLRGIAHTKRLKGSGKQEAIDSLRRVIEIVKADPGADAGDVARAMVDLGDLLTVWNDSRSKATYAAAWHTIPDQPEYDSLREELFGTPKHIVLDALAIRIRNRPWRVEGETFSDIKYVVLANGRARRLDVVDGNAPPAATRFLRKKLQSARFRPRMVDGEPVRTEDLVWHQEYKLY